MVNRQYSECRDWCKIGQDRIHQRFKIRNGNHCYRPGIFPWDLFWKNEEIGIENPLEKQSYTHIQHR